MMQQLRKVSKDIQNGVFSPVYVLYGSETFLMGEFLKFAQKKMVDDDLSDINIQKYDAKETPIEVAIQDVETLPFLSERKVVIVSNCTFLTAEKEKIEHDTDVLLRYLDAPSDFSCLFLIVNSDKMDERKKLVKAIKKQAVVIPFQPLKDEELYSWIEKRSTATGLFLKREQIHQLVSVVGNDLRTLQKEIEKIALYVGRSGVVTEEVITRLTTPALEQDVFQMVDAITKGDIHRSVRLLYDCLLSGEEPIKLLALLAHRFRLLLLIKTGTQQGKTLSEIATIAKTHPFAVKKAAEYVGSFTEKSLRNILLHIAEEDFRMKTGKVEKRLALELFITRVTGEVQRNPG